LLGFVNLVQQPVPHVHQAQAAPFALLVIIFLQGLAKLV